MKMILALPKKSRQFSSTKRIEQSFWKVDTKNYKFWAMEKVLENYGPCMTHLEQLPHTDS